MTYSRAERTSDPAVEPVSLSDMRLYLKSQSGVTAEDDLITSLIKTAREIAEHYTKRAFITQSWTIQYDEAPGIIELPFGQLQSVTSINIIDDDGTANLQSSDIYQVETGDYGTIFLESGNSWDTSTRPKGQMKIVFVAGYGDASTDLPEGIITGVKQIAAFLYENREAGINDMTPAMTTLQRYRLVEI